MTTLLEFPASTDERILCDLMRQITWQSDIDARRIRIEVANGIVYLRGTVQTCIEVVEAEHAAQAVYGVISVMNELEVHTERQHSDNEILRDLTIALRNTSSVLDQMPSIDVSDGVAILHGACRWEFQSLCAERTALSIIGVRRVVNLIEVDNDAALHSASVRMRLVNKAS